MAYQGQETGAQNNLAGASAKNETLQSIIASFQMQIERLGKLSQQLVAIGDRLEGGRPIGVQEAAPETPPHSLTDDLRRKHRTLTRLIGECEDATMRVNNALGV